MLDYKIVIQGDAGREKNYVATHAYSTLEECEAHQKRLWAQGAKSAHNWIEEKSIDYEGNEVWYRGSPEYDGLGDQVLP